MISLRFTTEGLTTFLLFILSVVPSSSLIHPYPKVFQTSIGTKSAFSRNSVLVSASAEDSSGLTVSSKIHEPNALLKSAVHNVAILSTVLSVALMPNFAVADEYGVETEAPTLFTGENVMICVKRGPLGACQKTVERTAANDNDKAAQYFKNPGQQVVDKDLAMRQSYSSDSENELVAKLKQQSIDNKERNDQIVKMKSLENDQSANFGPFDRQVVILNEDGKTFTLLQNPQAMRLKKLGYIKDRKFVKQPSKEVIEQALEADDAGFGEIFKGIFGDGKE